MNLTPRSFVGTWSRQTDNLLVLGNVAIVSADCRINWSVGPFFTSNGPLVPYRFAMCLRSWPALSSEGVCNSFTPAS